MPGPLSTPLYWQDTEGGHWNHSNTRHGSTFEGGTRKSGKTSWCKKNGKWQRCRANKYERSQASS